MSTPHDLHTAWPSAEREPLSLAPRKTQCGEQERRDGVGDVLLVCVESGGRELRGKMDSTGGLSWTFLAERRMQYICEYVLVHVCS